MEVTRAARAHTVRVRDHPSMIRHLLAPVLPAAAEAIGVPRTLPDATGIAVTFDDGPHPEGTPSVLEVLARERGRATFFLIGEQVERRPALAAEIVAAGHVVALHGYRHRLQLRMSASAVRDDVARGTAAIEDATGAAPTWHRPPYGVYSPAGLRAVRDAGLRPLLWSLWGKDWRRFTTPGRIATRVTRELSAGDVILLHDADFYSSHGSHGKTVRALPLLFAELRRREFATVIPG